MESHSFSKIPGKLQSSMDQWSTGCLKSKLHQLMEILHSGSRFSPHTCRKRRWDFFNIRKKQFTIHHYTTAITSVNIKMSKVWEYYEKLSKDEAKCLLCKKVVSCKASSTTGPIRHLEGNY